MTRSMLLLAGAGLLLAGCGKKEMLKEVDGVALPPRPLTSPAQPTPADLLTPGAQTRPTRFNELITKSQQLNSDRFDMPPPG